MGALRRLVLDTLKPLEPTIIELAQQISELSGVDSVNISIYEIDRKVENAKVTIEGPDIQFDAVEDLIRDLGGSIHSIDEAVALKVIDECAAARQLWFLHFFFFGEPFLNPKTVDYIGYARERGVRNLSVTTNLTCIDEGTLRKLIAHRVTSVHVSFEGLDRERYATSDSETTTSGS